MSADQTIKADGGKLRPSLFPWRAVNHVLRVLEFGANKYKPHSWQGVAADRYVDALLRHIVEWADRVRAEGIMCPDHESGLPTLAHIACNALFLLAHPPAKYYTLVTGDVILATDEYNCHDSDSDSDSEPKRPPRWLPAHSVGCNWNLGFCEYRRKVKQ
jgi:hypothetical protein